MKWPAGFYDRVLRRPLTHDEQVVLASALRINLPAVEACWRRANAPTIPTYQPGPHNGKARP